MHSDITTLLQEAQAGGEDAVGRLTDAVYEQLRQIAGSQMRRERPGHTLQPTELVNEAYLRLFRNQQVGWQNRSHFYAIAASQMRRILIEHGRRNSAGKRAGIHLELKETDAVQLSGPFDPGEVEALLRKLQEQDPAAARVVELKIFAGFTDDEVVKLTGATKTKVRADWGFARSWLAARLRRAE
jgi:RNA polymerase sigma-70 factor (ECF subfamily)